MFYRHAALTLSLLAAVVVLMGLTRETRPKVVTDPQSAELQVVAPYWLQGRILFTGIVANKESIYLLSLPSKKLRKVVDGESNNSFPVWAPNGKSFAFVSERDGNKEIYLGTLGSDEAEVTITRLTNRPEDDDHPAWSPDGQNVAFDSAKNKDSAANIFSVRMSDLKVSQLTRFKGRNTLPKWTRDGKGVTYSTNRFWPGWDLCTYTPSTESEACPLRGLRSFCRGEWSPKGRHLVHSFGAGSQVDIALYNADSDESFQIASGGGRSYDASWSSDGAYVVYAGETEVPEVFNLYAVDLRKMDDPKKFDLVKASYSLRYPSWHSDVPSKP